MGVARVASVAREVVSMVRRELGLDDVAERAVVDDWVVMAAAALPEADGTKAAAGAAARRTRRKDFMVD